MNRILLLGAVCGLFLVGGVVSAQQTVLPPIKAPHTAQPATSAATYIGIPQKRATGLENAPLGGVRPSSGKYDRDFLSIGPGDSVGYTYYDLQTNGAMPDRIINWPDATGPNGLQASMIWMAAKDIYWNDRGTHGALSNGSEWVPLNLSTWTRIEDVRTGFPDLDHFSTGQMVVVAHAASDIRYSLEGTAGTGQFFTVKIDGSDRGIWPRVAVGGNDVIHAIWTYQEDPNDNDVMYVRSTDQGNTWSTPVSLTGDNSALGDTLPSSAGGDTYAISANGDNVVVWYLTSGIQINQLRSNDGGQSWSIDDAIRIFSANNARLYGTHENADSVIYPDPSFGADTAVGFRTDTVAAPGSHFDVRVMADGTVHGVFAIYPSYVTRYYPPGGDTTASTYRRGTIYNADFNYTNVSLVYVKEAGKRFQAFHELEIASTPSNDEKFNNERSYAGGFSRWPKLGLDEQENVFLSFASPMRGDTRMTVPKGGGTEVPYSYSHIWAMWTEAGGDGTSWSSPLNLTPNGADCQFPSLASFVDDNLFIAYQADNFPGDFVTDTAGVHPRTISNVEVYSFAKTLLGPALSGVEDEGIVGGGLAGRITSSSPNPASGMTQIAYSIGTPGEASMVLYNSLGEQVHTILKSSRRLPGEYIVGFDASSLPTGSYLLALSINGNISTKVLNVIR